MLMSAMSDSSCLVRGERLSVVSSGSDYSNEEGLEGPKKSGSPTHKGRGQNYAKNFPFPNLD